jgi:hypothetical protein
MEYFLIPLIIVIVAFFVIAARRDWPDDSDGK